jgi:hypothetical protein
LIPKIKCTMFLKQLYYVYYNIGPKSAPKGVIVVCFHLIHYEHLNTIQPIEMTHCDTKSETFNHVFT